MEIDELESRWRALDRRLDASLRLNARLVRRMEFGRIGSALGRLARAVWIELAFHVAAVLWLGSYTAHHIEEIRFAVPAAALWLAAAALIGSCAYQLVQLSELRLDAPVVTVQAGLERLRAHRLHEAKWALLLSPLLWTLLWIVALDAVLGIDLYAIASLKWLVANVLFGIAAVPLLLGVARQLAARAGNAPWLQNLLDDVAGRSLTDARRAIRELAAFEDEPADV